MDDNPGTGHQPTPGPGQNKAAVDLLFAQHTTQLRTEMDSIVDELEELTTKMQKESQRAKTETTKRVQALMIEIPLVGRTVGIGVAILIRMVSRKEHKKRCLG